MDSIEEKDGWLDYTSKGFAWSFARIMPGTDLVVIDHPNWPYAFVMKKQDATREFSHWWWQNDFTNTTQFLQRAAKMSVTSGDKAQILAILDKRAGNQGWVKPDTVTFESNRLEEFRGIAREGLLKEVKDIGQLTQYSYTATMGALTVPAGAGTMGVDVFSTALDVATGKASVTDTHVVITAMAAGIPIAGKITRISTAAAGKIMPELGQKLDYVFGRATGSAHNIQRSQAMLAQMERIGLSDSAASRIMLQQHLEAVVNDASNIARTQSNGRIVRESLLMGPRGGVKVESIWEGDRLITVNLFGG